MSDLGTIGKNCSVIFAMHNPTYYGFNVELAGTRTKLELTFVGLMRVDHIRNFRLQAASFSVLE